MQMAHDIEIRVRYPETDPGGYLHHANYYVYFEMGRAELMRTTGRSYRELEREGCYVVVARSECRHHRPAHYDDLLALRTRLVRVRAASLEHEYHLRRGAELLAEGRTTVCCVDGAGRLRRWPDWMLEHVGNEAER